MVSEVISLVYCNNSPSKFDNNCQNGNKTDKQEIANHGARCGGTIITRFG